MKKFLSLMLVFVMIFALATPTLAANEGNYSFKDGVLTVSGIDEIFASNPYNENRQVKTLYVCRGVKSLANFAFEQCLNLSRVEISDTVTTLGKYAFDDASIKRIGIPKSVTILDGYMFDMHGLNSYSDSANKNMVVYCEKGSMAEEFAKNYGLKYVNATIVYGEDGKTMMVDAKERESYLAGGNWAANPDPVKMYAADGRTKLVDKTKVEANKKVGWYEGVTMYASDGRTTLVSPFKVAEYKKVGWYNGKPVKLYALDGRTKTVGANDVAAYEKAGWYNGKPVKMYAADGKTKTVGANDVAAYEKVGWYDSKPVKMYAADGRTKTVGANDVAAYKKVGWYTEPVIKMYALDGRSKYVEKSKVEANKKVGWYLEADYIIKKADQNVKQYGYNTAIKTLEKYVDIYDPAYIDDSATRGRIQNKITSLFEAWRKSINAPLAVIDWYRSENSIGTPEIHITFRNVSTKTITSFENKFTCYDAYGNVTTDFSIYNGTFTGWMDDVNIKPGDEETYYWTLYSNERTMSISWPNLLRAAFSDGTVWAR